MKLLVSPKDEVEAEIAANGGADIIDVKNPLEGSLGANFPWIIKKIRSAVPEGIEVSATIGDLPNLPGTASLAAVGVASLGVDYVKAGIFGAEEKEDAIKMCDAIVSAVKDYDRRIKVVIAGYGDWRLVGSIDPLILVDTAKSAKADYVMVDTKNKDGRTLLDYMSLDEVGDFVKKAKKKKIGVGLAGSLDVTDIMTVSKLKPDVVGVRGAVCKDSDRMSTLSEMKVRTLKSLIEEL
ncbi:MAG: (5-formylfuran-3-yl)methyl phosphate synthase [Candidatus Altiarchaeota archaeon]|nr:(5-formylfuran-3-yl)methyl phosphate synthase [Candidatus Altiarchaeota archaeon]